MALSRPGGVLLKDVYPGGPAAAAGLKSGDVVLQVDGVDVDDMRASIIALPPTASATR